MSISPEVALIEQTKYKLLIASAANVSTIAGSTMFVTILCRLKGIETHTLNIASG